MEYFRLRLGSLEILKSDKKDVEIEIVVIDKKNQRSLLAEFKKEGDGFIFQNFFSDLTPTLQKLVNIEDLGNLFHLMCYIVNNFILPEDERLAFPDHVENLMNEENEESEESFLDNISDLNFNDIKKKLDEED